MVWIWEHVPLWRPERRARMDGMPMIVQYTRYRILGQSWLHIERVREAYIRWRPAYLPVA